LGLTISKRLVEKMGGTLELHSEEGKGSVFSFTVPLTVDSAPRAPAPARRVDLQGLRVLVVDDNATNRMIRARNAPLLGHGPGDGRGRARRARSAAFRRARGPIVLALGDRRADARDGRLRAGAAHARAPFVREGAEILMLSSAGRPGRLRALPGGGRFPPLDQASETVRSARRDRPRDRCRAAARGPGCPRVDVPSQKSLLVLLAEDNAVNQRLALRMLEKRGTWPVLANNGRGGLAAAEGREIRSGS